MTTPTGEAPKRRSERTDNSVKKLPNGKGWRARPTLGTDPVTGKQVRPTKVFATKKAAQDWVTQQRSQWSTAAWTPKRPLPRHHQPATDRPTGRRIPPGPTGRRSALPLHNAGVWAGDVQPGPGQAGRAAVMTTRRCAGYMLRRLIDRTTVSAIAAEFGVSWHTVSAIAMRATADLIAAAGPDRLTGVQVIGVDEHRWAPRRVGPAGFVTLIIDLTPTHDQTGPVRLLDLVDGRSATALASWLAAQPASFAQAAEVIAMDGFAGYKTAATARPLIVGGARPSLSGKGLW